LTNPFLGVTIDHWPRRLTLSYSAQDPRNPRYCENELLHVMAANYGGPLHMNPKNAYDLRWVELSEMLKDAQADLGKEPINRVYAPWVHAIFSLGLERLEESFWP
jgi:isopentenyldiphosphate isomerase